MKQYISISAVPRYGVPVYAFDKLDGSNIRVEWNPKKGFWKFGSRKRLIGTDQDYLTGAENLIRENYEDRLSKIFSKQRYQRAIAFFEFYGENSFAGRHFDEPHKVTLIDVNPYKSSITNPDEFIDLYGHLGIPGLVFKGNFNKEIEYQIKTKKLPYITLEGVVCKVKEKNKQKHPLMFKVKTFEWLKRLKKLCEENEDLKYEEFV
jgi:hypothetical protein